MGKKKSSKGFHTPFKNLKIPDTSKAPPATKSKVAEPAKSRQILNSVEADTSFAQMMSDVVPMEDAKRIPPKSVSNKRAQDARAIATEDSLALEEFLSLASPQDQPSLVLRELENGSWEGRASGVNRQLASQLRRGEIPPRRELDLHGLQKPEAHRRLKSFVLECRRDAEQCVMVITGKGHRSAGGYAILKEAVPQWLAKPPFATHLLAFCPARPQDGGSGALYLLLRKSKK